VLFSAFLRLISAAWVVFWIIVAIENDSWTMRVSRLLLVLYAHVNGFACMHGTSMLQRAFY
jgi:hypothetical protein